MSSDTSAVAHERFVLYLHESLDNLIDERRADLVPVMNQALLVASWCDYPAGFGALTNFVRLPQGVDPDVFRDLGDRRIFDIATTGWVGTKINKEGNPYGEAIQECHEAAVNGALQIGAVHPGLRCTGELTEDKLVAVAYNRCRFVSGLRWNDGFELPVLEGMLCGCRPIVFDCPNYRYWWGEHAIFLPHNLEGLVSLLADYFRHEVSIPVSHEEKDYLKLKFGWKSLARQFWGLVLEAA